MGITMHTVSREFRYSINGYEVATIPPGELREEHQDEGLIQYGIAIGAIEDKGSKVTTYSDVDHGSEPEPKPQPKKGKTK